MAASTALTTKENKKLSKRALLGLRVAIVLLSPLMLLCMLEGVALVSEKNQAEGLYAWELVASRRIKLIDVTTQDIGYTLMKPNQHYLWRNIPVDINQAGFRDDDAPYQKPSGAFRILNLGDSVAMGWGVRKGDTYGDVLEKTLSTSAAGGGKVDVLNAAVPGWNQENALAYLKAEGLKYDPDLIIVDLTIVNDIYGANALKTQRRPPVIEWLNTNTHFWPFLVVQFRTIQANSQGRRIDVLNPPKDAQSYFPQDPASSTWDHSWKQIEQVFQIAKEKNIKFVLLLFPLEYQTLDPSYSTVAQQVFIDRAKAVGMPVIDLLPAFQKACNEKPGGKCQLEDHYLFADLWMHPSQVGHQITADQVKAWMANQAIVQAR